MALHPTSSVAHAVVSEAELQSRSSMAPAAAPYTQLDYDRQKGLSLEQAFAPAPAAAAPAPPPSTNVGAIVGGVLGGVLGLALLTTLGLLWWFRWRKRGSNTRDAQLTEIAAAPAGGAAAREASTGGAVAPAAAPSFTGQTMSSGRSTGRQSSVGAPSGVQMPRAPPGPTSYPVDMAQQAGARTPSSSAGGGAQPQAPAPANTGQPGAVSAQPSLGAMSVASSHSRAGETILPPPPSFVQAPAAPPSAPSNAPAVILTHRTSNWGTAGSQVRAGTDQVRSAGGEVLPMTIAQPDEWDMVSTALYNMAEAEPPVLFAGARGPMQSLCLQIEGTASKQHPISIRLRKHT